MRQRVKQRLVTQWGQLGKHHGAIRVLCLHGRIHPPRIRHHDRPWRNPELDTRVVAGIVTSHWTVADIRRTRRRVRAAISGHELRRIRLGLRKLICVTNRLPVHTMVCWACVESAKCAKRDGESEPFAAGLGLTPEDQRLRSAAQCRFLIRHTLYPRRPSST